LDLKDIKAIVELMKKNELTVFQLEREEFKLLIKKGGPGRAGVPLEGGYSLVAPTAPTYAAAPVAPLAGPAAGPAPAAAEAPKNTRDITSPMVGTFYGAPSPESPAFVKVGQKINEDTVVCIIEAMKVMNEIKAELKGTVVEVVAENGKPVQFGDVLIRVEPS
jgi:acetyl-CoA carboxylase biotin carboxyl carrier protein